MVYFYDEEILPLSDFAKREEQRKEPDVILTDKSKRLICLILGILLSLIVAVLGVMFAVSCYSLYNGAVSQPYTYESIGRAFGKIDLAVYILTGLGLAVSLSLFLISPSKEKLKAKKNEKTVTERLSGRVDLSVADKSKAEKILKERELRRILGIVNVILFVIEAFIPLFYILDPKNFPAESGQINNEVLRGMIVYCAFLLPLLVYEFVYASLTALSYKREGELLKEIIREGGARTIKSVDDTDFRETKKAPFEKIKSFFANGEKEITLGVRIALFGCAVLFIVIGIFNGGMKDVLIKAINICAECIGLG